MSLRLSISAEWVASHTESEQIRQTAARMRISVGDDVATHAEDIWSKSVSDDVFLSAYPLALWFAASWWRLRWEPPRGPDSMATLSWRLAHEMPAAGHGFVWPRLVFASDGEVVELRSHPTRPVPTEPIRYLADFRASVPVLEFERGIDEFLNLVVARLDAVRVESGLEGVWEEVLEERQDSAATQYRRLEAQLGYDADEATEATVLGFIELVSEAGEAAVDEIAPICAGDRPLATLDTIRQWANSVGVEGQLQRFSGVSEFVSEPGYSHAEPWERGRRLASQVRVEMDLDCKPLTDAALAAVLSTSVTLFQDSGPATGQRLGLAVRTNGSERVKILLHRRNPPGRRFEAARLFADGLVAGVGDHWLPATDAKMARQKFQRAFAAEFLCPIGGLRERLNGDHSEDALTEAGDYFGVSSWAVRSHLALNGDLPLFDLGAER